MEYDTVFWNSARCVPLAFYADVRVRHDSGRHLHRLAQWVCFIGVCNLLGPLA